MSLNCHVAMTSQNGSAVLGSTKATKTRGFFLLGGYNYG